MSISLITDGMLYPLFRTLAAPVGGEGIVEPIPVLPCDPRATYVPCGPMDYDPTIDPPCVPETGEAPATPRCPQGRKT